MELRLRDPKEAVSDHGGSLVRADAMFPDAAKPWLDLSTGINPHSYPLLELPASAYARLPEEMRARNLADAAAKAYGAQSAGQVVCAPGTQVLLPLVASLIERGRAMVLSPTYAEHSRTAALAGHEVEEVADFNRLFDARLAVVVNPNNPDGRLVARERLLELAAHMRRKSGLLVVDEAFMDVGPKGASVAGDVETGGLVVLRSFGKFFGLAGVRLGFAIASPPIAEKLNAWLGPWAVSGPALEYGIQALGDVEWQDVMRLKLRAESDGLDTLFAECALPVSGGTDLFRFLRMPHAPDVFSALGQSGILVRRFADQRDVLRIGLPGSDAGFDRLANALRAGAER